VTSSLRAVCGTLKTVPLGHCEVLKVALIYAFPALAWVLVMRVREPVSPRPMGEGVEPLEATRSQNSLQKTQKVHVR
jgi:hypothetical protein